MCPDGGMEIAKSPETGHVFCTWHFGGSVTCMCCVGLEGAILEDGSKHRQTFTEAQAGLLGVSITAASKHKEPVCGLEQP